jgi:outer membrane protein OmpA-like peptidoglycan-associated protein
MSAPNPFPSRGQDGEEWISVSDLMAGLMIVFLAIAVFFMVQLKGPVDEWIRTRERLSLALSEEFQDSLSSWNAEIIDSTLTIRIPTPEVLFPTGSATLRPRFQEILDDFFPRFVAVLMGEEFRDHIPEVRIEGHTSSFWEGEQDPLRKYENNMRLSQDRSRAVLSYVSRLNDLRSESV